MLIPEELDKRVRKAAQRGRVSKGEWVRRALEESLKQGGKGNRDPVARLAALNAPTADLEQMLAQIEDGRS